MPVNGSVPREPGVSKIGYNSILYGNGDEEMFNDAAEPRVGYTLIEGGIDGISELNGSSTTDEGGNIDAVPNFVNADLPAGLDGTAATSDDGLRLRTGSPALDAGVNGAIDLNFDITGATRIQGDTVDMGAYEGAPADPAEVVYVDAGATGAADGTSWADAYPSLQDALGAATGNDALWIAEGAYTPGPDAGDSFTLTGSQDGLKIYGGFETGDDFADRTPGDHPVILDGNDTNNSVLFFDGKSGDNITSATVLEGVTLTGGAGNGGGLFCDGGGRAAPPAAGCVRPGERRVFPAPRCRQHHQDAEADHRALRRREHPLAPLHFQPRSLP